MIRVTLMVYTTKTHNTKRTEKIENVTTIDSDNEYLRIITGDGELWKIEQEDIIGYTAEVI